MNEKDIARTMKFEAIKMMIEMFKNAIMALIVAIFGMVSYLFINIEKISNAKILTIVATISVAALIVFFCVTMLFKKIKEVEDLR